MLALLGISMLVGFVALALEGDDDDTMPADDSTDGDQETEPEGRSGTPQNDLVYMDDDGDDWYDGQDGDDTIYSSRDGDDTIYGSGGDDILFGSQDNLASPQPGGSELYGGDGDDTLNFAGHDTASGGDGRDVFVAAGSQSVIADFDEEQDMLRFEVFDGLNYSINQEVTEQGISVSITPDDDAYSGHSVLLKGLTTPISSASVELVRVFTP